MGTALPGLQDVITRKVGYVFNVQGVQVRRRR